ncbi:hypothetical protein [Xenorhabdus hominickii]|uniref:Phage-related membrane protein n=1 Tax=Xenorhabdus hominickii TaxID=351679 RepID=A0A2G0Q1H2_XENHO|nr:hypothetical protein [Xenorhabdus hominickii]AOM40420.1 hypothetical protein A9255_07405 [Xenorhabdus hominickii]PHM53062.1 hypothetical protein Xhom_03945 [Xenorhabdus hominickii]
MANFSTIVELYRASSKPSFDGRSFSATVELTDNVHKLIASLIEAKGSFGSFEDLELDGEHIEEDDILSLTEGSISYTFITPKNNGAERFYREEKEFIGINSIKKGTMPNNYYIASIDYCSQDDKKPDFILKIEKTCSIIKSLAEIAHFHDTKSELNNYRLVFVRNSDAKSTSIALETSFSEKMLECDHIDDGVLKNIITNDSSTMPHYAEKIGIFRNTLVEFISEKDYTFEMLIQKWPDFIHLFENNLSTYMSGFSFHKARKEVATAEAEFAEKISKITNELTNKVLSLPVSLLASLGIFKLTNSYEILVILSGIILTSIFVFLILFNQEKQFFRICHAKDIAFKPFNTESIRYPEDLKVDIKNALDELNNNQRICRRTIRFFKFLSWVPTFVAIGIFLYKIF